MKNIGIAFALLVALASCSKSELETPRTPTTPDLSAPIVLSADIQANAVGDKAAISGTAFTAHTPDVFRLTAYAGSALPNDWSSAYFFDQQVDSGASSLIAFHTAQYYPADGSQKLYFYAYAPATSVAVETSSTPPIAHYTITGQEDIMAAQAPSGIAKAVSHGTQSQPELNFEHKLKQVQFVVQQDAAVASKIKVTSITIKEQKCSAKLDISTGGLTFEGTTGDLTAYADATGVEITTEGSVIPGSIMFEPGTTFSVDLVANGVVCRGIDVTLTGTNAGAAGVNHTVTLTFKHKEVASTASVGAWTLGAGNSADLK